MLQFSAQQNRSILLFVGLVTTVYAVAMMVTQQLSQHENADILSMAITLDMVVLVPLAFYFLIIRRRGYSIIRLAPIVILSLVLASLIVPKGHQQALHILEFIVLPLEFGLLGWIVWRATKALKQAGHNTALDPLEQFRSAAFGLLKNDRAAGVFASEIGVIYYSLGAWRTKPHCPADFRSFTHHHRSGQGGLVFAFLVLMAGEGFAVHLLLERWSSIAAWLFTLSTVYAAFGLFADFRATVLRPILIGEKGFKVRAGLRYSMEIPRSLVSEVSHQKPDFGKENLSLKLMGPATHWIILSEPIEAEGPYGTRRLVRAIGLEPDDGAGFEQSILISNTP